MSQQASDPTAALAQPAAAQPPIPQAAMAAQPLQVPPVAPPTSSAGAPGPALPLPLPAGAVPLPPGAMPLPASAALPMLAAAGMLPMTLAAAAAAGGPVPTAGPAVVGAGQPTNTMSAADAVAKLKFQEMGAAPLFEKVLTSSDANGSGRIVIPKGQAEAHLPPLEAQSGTTLQLTDTFGKKHTFKFRFWINNQSRMYLLENTQEVQQRYNMQVGDVLVFGKLPDGAYAVMGRRGTKDDSSRKAPTKRPADGATPGGGGGGGGGGKKAAAAAKPRQPAESLKTKRIKQKQAAQQVQSSYTYWSGYSLPPRRDGVFRAVPNSAAEAGDKVVAQYGCWTAIVNLGGELYQAFFENYDAANAAFEAARQSGGGAAA